MPQFLVSARGGAQATVEAGNWLTALGLGLDRFGVVEGLDRLACEVLPNGTVIARDARTGLGYVVQPAREDREGPAVDAPLFLDEEEAETEILTFGEDISLTGESSPFDEEIDTGELAGQAVLRLVQAIRASAVAAGAWQTALEVAQELVPSEAASALRMEPGGALRFVAATGPQAPKLMGVLLPVGTGVVGFCCSRGMGLIVNNPAEDRRFYREMDMATGFSTRSILCVPVMMGRRVLGCLELLNAPDGQGFERGQLELVELATRALGARLEHPG